MFSQSPISVSSDPNEFGFEEVYLSMEQNTENIQPSTSTPQRNFSLDATKSKRKRRQTNNDYTDLMRQVTEVMRSIEPPKEEVSRGRTVTNSIA